MLQHGALWSAKQAIEHLYASQQAAVCYTVFSCNWLVWDQFWALGFGFWVFLRCTFLLVLSWEARKADLDAAVAHIAPLWQH